MKTQELSLTLSRASDYDTKMADIDCQPQKKMSQLAQLIQESVANCKHAIPGFELVFWSKDF